MRTEPAHRMHLKGPWSYEWLDGPRGPKCEDDEDATLDSPLLTDSRVRMPSSMKESFGKVSGRVLFRRRFQRPTNLDDNERVHIAFDGIGGRAEIAVNGQTLGSLENNSETVSFDMTRLLEQSNELTVDLTISWGVDQRPGGLYEPVAIEIHRVND
ncbi:MAG: beta-galactosidase/beta-glucuronidase [Planctomycetaceae bacterium]|jgi:beta-galactosidase/beta-glucuronidase